MENETEIHKRITEDFKLNMRLDKINKGLNLVNSQKEYAKPYYVEVLLEVDMNLIKTKTALSIRHNLPTEGHSWERRESSLRDFFALIKSWSSLPIYERKSYNRKRQIESWQSSSFKEKKVNVAEVEITVYPEAANFLGKILKIKDFKSEVIKLLESQRYANDLETKDFNKWSYLVEKTLDLKELVKPDNEGNRYSYGEKAADKTIKAARISPKQYNKQLKEIENELKGISEKYGWLKVPRLEYAQVVEKPTFKAWKEENDNDLTEAWEALTDEEAKEFKNFLDFCKHNFKEWLEENSEAFEGGD